MAIKSACGLMGGLFLALLTGCSDDGGGGGSPSQATPEGVVGFWASQPVNCGPVSGLAYGLALCDSRKLSGLWQGTYEGTLMKYLWEGSYSLNDTDVSLSLTSITIEPSIIAGDRMSATMQLEYDAASDTLTFTGGEGQFLCEGLPLERTDSVTDADCESSTDPDDGCTADVDCPSTHRCERSTGRCVLRAS